MYFVMQDLLSGEKITVVYLICRLKFTFQIDQSIINSHYSCKLFILSHLTPFNHFIYWYTFLSPFKPLFKIFGFPQPI